jgi:hypothetical protein
MQPNNINFLSPLGFRLIISKLPTVAYNCRTATLPSLTLGEVAVFNPNVTFYEPGDKLIFEPFTIRFGIDEDFQNYLEIYNWMVGLGSPISPDQYASFTDRTNNLKAQRTNIFSDATLQILTSHKNPNFNIKFVDIFPVSLSPLDFDSTNTDVEYLEANLTCRYRDYTIENIS